MSERAAAITEAVVGLDRWFEARRVAWPTPGYGGPVVHWWNHCLVYRGAGFDWRYEGIIAGYLSLWQVSRDQRWLDAAIRAGNDLVTAQQPDGCWPNSRFELNPGAGGTPHEAACALALISLAKELRRLADPAADRYLVAARRHVADYALGRLWHEATGLLRDSTHTEGFVPNKAATTVEALLLLSELTADPELVERYAVPTGDHILGMQVRRPGDLLDGAIAQNRLGNRVITSYFPLYNARCIPSLLRLWECTGLTRFRDSALAAAAFLVRVRNPDGGLPQVLYPRGRSNRWPRWIAAAGDVVRALDLVSATGTEVDPEPTVTWLLRGVRRDGRIATAEGFGRLIPLISRRDRFADELGVVGWCDKAFRALAPRVDPTRLSSGSPPTLSAQIDVTNVVR